MPASLNYLCLYDCELELELSHSITATPHISFMQTIISACTIVCYVHLIESMKAIISIIVVVPEGWHNCLFTSIQHNVWFVNYMFHRTPFLHLSLIS